MPYIQVNKTGTIGKKRSDRFSITIPKEIIRITGWKKGVDIKFTVSKKTGNIEVVKAGETGEKKDFTMRLIELNKYIEEEATRRYEKLKREGKLVKKEV